MAKAKTGKADSPKKTTRKLSGKSAAKAESNPTVKPYMYLDDSQIPKELQNSKVGSKVTLTMTGKVVGMSEHSYKGGTSKSVNLEFDKVQLPKKKGK
jgi:hypothetical protein